MSDIVLVNLEGRRPNKPSEEKNLIPKTCTVTTPEEEFEPARRNPKGMFGKYHAKRDIGGLE